MNLGYPTGPVRMKAPDPIRIAMRLAEDVKTGKKTADKAVREYISALSFHTKSYVPTYSAKVISAGADAIYAAEIRYAKYRDPAEQEAHQVLEDALKGVMKET